MADWPLVPDEEAFAPGSLLRTAQQVHDRLWQELVPGGCTSPQFAVLHRLALRPGIDQRTLGEAAGLDSIAQAVHLGQADRLGHGARIIDDIALADQTDGGVAFEMPALLIVARKS